MSNKVVLMILDGWGLGDKSKSDAIHHANTPFIDSCYERYPNAQLRTDGEHVGLPKGQMGNSEVGHLNIGAGRVVHQELARINQAIADKSIDSNPVLIDAFKKAKEQGRSLHFMGLMSTGGVHSHQEHLHYLCSLASQQQVPSIFVHAFMDGRDRDPKSGLQHIKDLEEHLNDTNAELVSVIGRYYAMDRDKRWERVKKAYDLLCQRKGKASDDLVRAIQESYDDGITDEFIQPIVKINEKGEPTGSIKPNDVVVVFNFRTDRCREITTVLTQQDMPEHSMQTIPLHYVTMTRYDDSFKDVQVVFEKENLSNTLGEVLEKAKRSQVRVAETEKYPHVTFFFSGGREEGFSDEERLLIASPKVTTYDLQPEMSAKEVTASICGTLENDQPDFICLNFANTDMVGHTGNYQAVTSAIETVDDCAGQVVEAGLKNSYSFLIIADHGNADYMINPDGSPNTAHSLNPVPCIVIDDKVKNVADGVLADIAPTILHLMDIEIPEEMMGKVLAS